MKKLVVGLFIILFSLAFTLPATADRKKHGNDKRGNRVEKHYKQPRGHAYGYRHKYHGHRHYHPRHYHGHWRSWRSWEDYHHHHRHDIKRKRYYRKDNSLYVEIETDEGRFVFSIGR